jgi:2-hydroxychromene-2-carboxylate isomerase
MPAQLEYYFDFISPYSYMASTQLPRLTAELGTIVRYHPFTLIELMHQVGNRPTTLECQNKGVYVASDLQRWARRYQVDFATTPYWQRIDFCELGRGALVAIEDGRGADYVRAICAALFGQPLDLSQRPTLLGVLDRAGLAGARLLQRAAAPEWAARLEHNTTAAAQRGVFGSPTLFVGEEMFFGNDRLDFVADALRAPAASAA